MEIDRARLLAAAVLLVPAFLWVSIAWDVARFLWCRRPEGAFPRVLLAVTAGMGIHYLAGGLLPLLHGYVGRHRAVGAAIIAVLDATVIIVMAVGRHFVRIWPLASPLPGRAWLAANYGLCGVVLAIFLVADLRLASIEAGGPFYAVFTAYFVGQGVLLLRDLRRLAGGVAWRPGALWQARRADVLAAGAGFVLIVAAQLVPAVAGTTPLALLLGDPAEPLVWSTFVLNGLGAFLFAMPFVVRNLGDLVPSFLANLAATAAVAGVYLGARRAGVAAGDPVLEQAIELAAIIGLVLVVMPARAALQGAIARVVFRRGRLRWADLQRFVQSLPPEAGTEACCRHVLERLVRDMRLDGAAVLLVDGEPVVEGRIDVAGLRPIWPPDPTALPVRPFAQAEFRTLPASLAEALAAADVLVLVPVVSPRRHWGHLLVTTDLRGASLGDDDEAALATVAGDLALVLDAAGLLARAVAVERALAHAEKLAAVGELAARVAHEIRNPVTAARSLAQQLAREAGPGPDEPARLVVEELARVERQVAALLRFARREELRREAVDLGALVRGVVRALQPRLDAAGIAVVLDTPDRIVAPADREKVRQVVVNLVENAIDALAAGGGLRRLTLGVTTAGGSARVHVADTGPGVPPDVLPRVFEPFFSRKPSGTGLGLAIVRRIVEAHGGRIAVTSRPGEGARFDVHLPLAELA